MFSADDWYDDEGNSNNFSITIFYKASSKNENVLDSILDFDLSELILVYENILFTNFKIWWITFINI